METARHPNFRKLINSLPKKVQEKAKEVYLSWKEDPNSVKSKLVNGCDRNVFAISFNVEGTAFRVLGIKTKQENKERCVWFWIGSHEDYNNYVPIQRDRLKAPEVQIINSPTVQNMLEKIKNREEFIEQINSKNENEKIKPQNDKYKQKRKKK